MVIRRVVLHTDRKSASFCERAATRVSWDHHANRAHVGTHTRTTPLLTVTLTILGPQSPVLGTNYLKSEWFVPKTGLRFWKGWSADTKMLSPPNQAATTTNIATYTDRWCYYFNTTAVIVISDGHIFGLSSLKRLKRVKWLHPLTLTVLQSRLRNKPLKF